MHLWQKVAIGTAVTAVGAVFLFGGGGKAVVSGGQAVFTGSQQLVAVTQAFLESKGSRYSWGGGHGGNVSWPKGGPGSGSPEHGNPGGGIGWDCSGWVRAVIKRMAPGSKADVQSSGVHRASELWATFGSPRNGLSGAKAGDIVFWKSSSGNVVHVGFLTSALTAVSAMGDQKYNGNDASHCVKSHGTGKNSTGLEVMGTSSWLA